MSYGCGCGRKVLASMSPLFVSVKFHGGHKDEVNPAIHNGWGFYPIELLGLLLTHDVHIDLTLSGNVLSDICFD